MLKTIEQMKSAIEPEIERHFTKWGGDPITWYENIEYMKSFAENRSYSLRQNYISKFDLKGIYELQLNVSDQSFGKMTKVNSLVINKFPWKGEYSREFRYLSQRFQTTGISLSGGKDT